MSNGKLMDYFSFSVFIFIFICSKQEAEKDISDIHVALVELPTQRYVRRVAKTPLDLLSK